MTHRMFVAANPTDDVAAALERFVEPRRQDGSTLRWVHWGQWHLTLAFFGTVPGRRVDDLGDLLDEVALNTDPVELTVGRAGAFPSPYAAHALWLGVGDRGDVSLEALARRCRTAGSRVGATVQGGGFVGHLTVARSGPPVEATRWLRVLDAFAPLTWRVGEIALVESRLGVGVGGSARHTEVRTFPLGR